jgi:hypothetical protein
MYSSVFLLQSQLEANQLLRRSRANKLLNFSLQLSGGGYIRHLLEVAWH